MNIPSNIRPRLIESTQTNGCSMTYDFMLNQIAVNPNMKTPTKEVYLSFLRHELQHFMPLVGVCDVLFHLTSANPPLIIDLQ